MEFDYYYGREAESFRFIRLPIVLFEDEVFKELSIDAKVLYALYLSRTSLSYKNDWLDKNGRIYIIFTVDETSKILGCGEKKAIKLIKELENIGLIEKRRKGQGNPTIIYVKNFMTVFLNDKLRTVKRESLDLSKRQFKNSDFESSRPVKKEVLEKSKRQSNYIENNNNDLSKNNRARGQPARTYYGEYENVLLSLEEYEELSNLMGKHLDYMIGRLSSYMNDYAKTYKNHKDKLIEWYKQDKTKLEEDERRDYKRKYGKFATPPTQEDYCSKYDIFAIKEERNE